MYCMGGNGKELTWAVSEDMLVPKLLFTFLSPSQNQLRELHSVYSGGEEWNGILGL